MRRVIAGLFIIAVAMGCTRTPAPQSTPEKLVQPTTKEGVMLHWLGHASVMIESKAGKVVYIDPWEVDVTKKADLILITHEHYDHCSPDDVNHLSKDDTVIVATADCSEKLRRKVETLSPGQKGTFAGFEVEAVHAYNTNKEFHPADKSWVGYIVTVDGERIYHPGDVDVIQEFVNVECDIAFLPVGGTYTMNAEEAAQATTMIKANEFIPFHWGKIVGSQADATKFKELTKAKVTILPKE